MQWFTTLGSGAHLGFPDMHIWVKGHCSLNIEYIHHFKVLKKTHKGLVCIGTVSLMTRSQEANYC